MADSWLHRLVRDLKRRKVFRVAGVYAVVAWGVIEVSETVFPILLLPGWMVTAVTVLVLLGFPLAVVLAWAFEVTPEGVRRTAGSPASSAGVPGRAGAWVGALGLIALAVAAGAGYLLMSSSSDGAVPDRSIAVLPFENMSGDPENEYFSDGITDDILTSLSQIANLRVISRTSVMTYKDSEKTIPEIADELGVAFVLEGSVRRADGRVRITAQLVHAASDGHRWAERYDRRLTDVFAIQGEIARAIAQELRAELSPAERDRIEAEPTGDMVAYEHYLKGRGLLDERTPTGMRRAIEHFQRAIRRDSAYALAWAGLADAVSLLEFYDYEVPASVPPAMRTAARAVELAPELGQAHASLGIALSLREDGPRALRELERAVELTPGYAEAYAWLGWVNLMAGDPAAAVRPAERAVALDPLAPAFRAYLGETYLAMGRAEEALREARRAREIQPAYGLAHFMEALALVHAGRPAEAEAFLHRARELVPPDGTPSHAEIDGVLGIVHVAAGDTAVARRILRRLDPEASPDAAFSTGLILSALGDVDGAIAAFRRVDEWGSFSNEHLRYFFPAALGPVRRDPRYPELIRAVDRQWAADQPPDPVGRSTAPEDPALTVGPPGRGTATSDGPA